MTFVGCVSNNYRHCIGTAAHRLYHHRSINLSYNISFLKKKLIKIKIRIMKWVK